MSSAQPSRLPGARNGKPRPISMYSYGNDTPSTGIDSTTTSKQAKRRSLLPQFTRKVSEELQGPDTITEDGAESMSDATPAPSLLEADRDDTKVMPPPPRPTRAATRILAPGTVGRSNSVRTHARSQSRDGTMMADAVPSASRAPAPTSHQRMESGLKRTGSTRLPLSPSKPRHAPSASISQPRGVRDRSSSTNTAPLAPADKRSSVNLGRPTNINTAIPYHAPSQTSPTSPTSSTTSRQSASRGQPSGLSRPAFSTYQQHYSPAKPSLPKATVPHVKVAARLDSVEVPDVALTLDVVKDQIELWQLSMLHQDAVQAMAQYEASARRKLSRKHAQLKKDLDQIKAIEGSRRQLENLVAVETWCPDAALLAEHLHTFSRVVSELCAFTGPDSRYSNLTAQFGKWVTKAEANLFDAPGNALFLEALPDTWRATHTSLALKLRSIQREMNTLPPPPVVEDSQSSLEIMLEICSSFIDSMLKELEVMTKLQKEVLQQERERIDDQVNALTRMNEQHRDAEKENWVPAW